MTQETHVQVSYFAVRKGCLLCRESGETECSECSNEAPCDVCKGTGSVGSIYECACTRQEKPLCSICQGTRKQKCKCIAPVRVVWESPVTVFGVQIPVTYMLEVFAPNRYYLFLKPEGTDAWKHAIQTPEADAEVQRIREMVSKRCSAVRERIAELAAKVPDRYLEVVEKTLEGFLEKHVS